MVEQEQNREETSTELKQGEELLTLQEMAQRLKVPNSWVYSRTRIKGNDFPVVRVGKYCRFNPDAVLDWLNRQSKEVA